MPKERNYINLSSETSTNTKVVSDELNSLFQDYVTKNPIPLDVDGRQKFTVSVIGFGSMARKELLFVSDIDIQIIVVASKVNTGEARIYTNHLIEHVKNEWSKTRKSINSSPDANALEIDNIGGNEGVIVVNTPQAAAEYMKPKKMGAKGYSDVYADPRPIYESEQGVYRTMFDKYEVNLQNTAINGLINEALADLGALPKTLSSAKQTFIRPITLAIGGLYRKLRYKLGSKLPYETNTLKRAMFMVRIFNQSLLTL